MPDGESAPGVETVPALIPNQPPAHTRAAQSLLNSPDDLPLADVEKWVADGVAIRTSDGKYLALREIARDTVVDYLLDKYQQGGRVDTFGETVITNPLKNGPFVYHVVFVQAIGRIKELSAAGTDFGQLLRNGRTTAAADALEKKYLAANATDKAIRNGSAAHLTRDQAIALRNAIMGPWRAAAFVGVQLTGEFPLTRRFLFRYLDKTGGTVQLRYSDFSADDVVLTQSTQEKVAQMISAGTEAAYARRAFQVADLATAIHNFELRFQLHETPAHGARNRRGTVAVTFSDTYDFDGTTGQNIPFAHLSTLSSWPTDEIRDTWMWDLEQYGLAKRFFVTAKWIAKFEVPVDAAGKPIGPVNLKVQR